MQPETALVDLDRIHAEDNRYRISDSGSVHDLAESICSAGLISPPTVQPRKGRKGFRIVAGFRRVAACRHIGLQSITCRVVPEDATGLSCWKIAIADNALTRSLSLLEQARATAGLMDVCAGAVQAAELAAALGLALNSSLIRKLTRLLTLADGVQQAVARNRMSLNIAMRLETMDRASASAFSGICLNLKPTVNHQQELLTGLHELACLRQCTIAELLGQPDFEKIFQDADADRRSQLQALRRVLYRLRYPELSRAEAVFATRKQNLGLPGTMDISAPPGFESTVYTLTVRFSEPAQLCDSAEKLAVICRDPELSALLNRDINEDS